MDTFVARQDADVIIVGAGPAGLGLAIALAEAGARAPLLLEARGIGASFRNWPRETRLLTPSFPAEEYGVQDLNSVFPGRSPASFCGVEHLSGPEYADWLNEQAEKEGLRVDYPVEVKAVAPTGDGFELHTTAGPARCRCLVWATGEFFFPKRPLFPGSQFAVHYAEIDSWVGRPGERFVVVGGAESGIDTACALVQDGKQVTVLDCEGAWVQEQGDPSTVLSPRTRERLRDARPSNRLQLIPDARVTRIEEYPDGFAIFDREGRFYGTDAPPVLCCGFEGGATQIRDLWDWRQGRPCLTEHDESTRTPGLFLVGPQVRQPGEIFCFIYKFRTRFPRVTEQIQRRLASNTAAEAKGRFA